MEPINRRRALQLGALGALGVVGGGVGLSRTGLPWAKPTESTPGEASAAELVEPEVLSSDQGVLRVELVARLTRIEVAGRQVEVLTYNGTLPGPTWRVHPGDRLEVRLVNQLGTPTNLHTHGLVVSPQGNSDNPFLTIEPGESFDYRFDLPPDHPTGPFWYHPHLHGTVADQVFGGLYGAIIVEPATETIPVSRERTLVLSDISFTSDGQIRAVSPPQIMMGREGEIMLVNGQHQPQISARAGERERWRIINACTSRYLRLTLPDHATQVLGVDSGREPGSQTAEGLVLAPGNRADLLVTMSGGSSELGSLGYDRGHAMMGRMGRSGSLSGPVKLASLAVTGQSTETFDPVPLREPGRYRQNVWMALQGVGTKKGAHLPEGDLLN